MLQDVFVLAEHFKGEIIDSTYELLGRGREIAEQRGGKLYAVLLGNNAEGLAGKLGISDLVIYVEDPVLGNFNPEAYNKVLTALVKDKKPGLIMVSSTSQGYDLGAFLGAELDIPFISNSVDLVPENGGFKITSRVYGGKILVDTAVKGEQIMAAFLTGAFPGDKGKSEKKATIEKISSPVSLSDLKIKFKSLIEPEAGDVDITRVPVVVGVGRGVGNQDGIEGLQELAGFLGGAVAGSRPVIDQKWLPKTRQVGKSGLIVKPKIYIAAGISGAPEHVEGMKDAGTVIAINSDANAPIFQVADYGVVADMFDILPPLKEVLEEKMG